MRKFLQQFLRNEAGAVSVDFVVLTAAVAVLGTLVVSIAGAGGVELAGNVSTLVANHSLTTH